MVLPRSAAAFFQVAFRVRRGTGWCQCVCWLDGQSFVCVSMLVVCISEVVVVVLTERIENGGDDVCLLKPMRTCQIMNFVFKDVAHWAL